MRLFQLLGAIDPAVDPGDCKVHLAVWNGSENPLHVYFERRFDEWQAWQSKRNFERPVVISLIQLPTPDRWLFAGTHAVSGCVWLEEHRSFHYRMTRRAETDEVDGRLVVAFRRTGRQSYLLGENWADAMEVAEILPKPMTIASFPGYANVLLTKEELDLVVEQGIESWRSALLSVSGVYLIADRSTGQLYVGSAYGEGGIWARWSAYSQSGHGGNVELRDLLRQHGTAHARNFQFGVLEIADTHASREDILAREGRWKTLLMTRSHGLNGN